MVAIINYGLGNINAFCNIYKKLSIDYVVADKESKLNNATRLILPGVGSYDRAMNLLNQSGMRSKIDKLVLEKKIPIIGICVGMQILGINSEEGRQKGLGYIRANVKKLVSKKHDFILPHMGWNKVAITQEDKILKNVNNDSRFYFLHSYHVDCDDELVIGTSNYFGTFTSIINYDNIYGVQFHPEKSHDSGTTVLKNFADL